MICGERGISMPEPNPRERIASAPSRIFFARLSDELLMDYFRALLRSIDRANRIDCLMLDACRAEFAVRHASYA